MDLRFRGLAFCVVCLKVFRTPNILFYVFRILGILLVLLAYWSVESLVESLESCLGFGVWGSGCGCAAVLFQVTLMSFGFTVYRFLGFGSWGARVGVQGFGEVLLDSIP